MNKVITLTTDFGAKDPYQGTMKGVMLSINPEVHVVDISHSISAGNIIEGAFTLSQAYRFFPVGTIHIGVVDPGVGGKRRPILVETEKYVFIGPDNGLFSLILNEEKIRGVFHLNRSEYFLEEVSATFHGRDVFAPVAARLSLGIVPEKLGDRIDDPCIIEFPVPEKKEQVISGEVIHIDTFGNLITNIKRADIKDLGNVDDIEVSIRGIRIKGLKKTYSDAAEGAPIALIGSSGRLEIACFLKSASDVLGVKVGEKVEISIK